MKHIRNISFLVIYTVCVPLFLFLSCASSEETIGNPPPDFVDQGTSITIDNPTRYNVYFDQDQRVGKNANGMITLYIESGTLSRGFDIWYEIPLSSGVPVFCKGDHRTIRENQTSLTINEPRITEAYGTFLVIHNKADGAITFNSGGTVNPLVEQRGSPGAGNYLARTDKREFSPGETAVFDISRDSGLESHTIRESRKATPLALPRPLQQNHLYTFEYSADGIVLTDSRPLHRAGERGWVETIGEAAGPMALAAAEGGICLFAPEGRGLVRYDYDSAGGRKQEVISGDSFEITSAAGAADGFLLAGYEGGNRLTPIVRIQGEDGQTRRFLEPSNRPEHQSAYFMCAAQKDDSSWLAAGGAAADPAYGYTAYARLVRDTGASLSAEWELGKAEFDAQTPADGAKCGRIMSAVYDPGEDRWLVCGENIESDMWGSVSGSYIAVITGEGVVQKIDASFRGLSLYRLLIDPDGDYYAAGEEHKGSESFAVFIKYSAEGGELWRLSSQPASHSYYYDAVPDYGSSRVILAGTMRAAAETGQGGIPFIEAVDIEKGTLLWREELSGSGLAGAALVTAIAPAPDYGFVITLSGMDDGFEKPFMIARLNSQGKLLKEIQQ